METPSAQALQVFYGTLPLVAAILLTNWNNNRRLEDLKVSLNKRIDDMALSLNKRLVDLTMTVNAGFTDVKTSLSKLEARVADLEKGNYVVRS